MPRGVAIIENWDRDLLPKVKERLSFFGKRGIPRPTLRAMFYALVSLGILPNTKSYYVSLSAHTVVWRENHVIPIDCFLDESRHVIEDFDDEYESPQEYIDRLTEDLKNAALEYPGIIPRWHKQPHYMEAWTEKNAQIGILRSILRDGDVDRQVRIVPTGGYGSVGYGIDNVRRLHYWQTQGKEVHIRYFGDIDPSGEDIDRVMKRKLAKYGLYNIDVKRVALTDELNDKYQLPRKPDPDTFKKLNRDPRAASFRARHNGELFQVEIDALVAKAPDVFRDLVIKSVDELFDDKIHEKALNEYSESETNKILKKSARSLIRKLR